MEVKKSTTWTGKLKKITLDDGKLIDENGEIIELMDILEQFYSDKMFDIAITAKEDEILEYEEELVID